jgi:hypothetical protein
MAAPDLFSKVSRRMWRDEKFVALSAPPPNARDLWVYLLTGPHNGTIPGLFVLGELALAEDMEWDPEPTRSCLHEILAKGMARFDRKRRLFWLPNAIAHNLPRSPKQVIGWSKAWKLLPECSLLAEAAAGIRGHLAAKSPKLAEAFDQVVMGLVEPVDSSGELDLGDEVDPPPPTARSATSETRGISLSDRERDSYPIENAVPIRFQEQEKEQEKDPPFGGVRACAREAPSGVGEDRSGFGDSPAGQERRDVQRDEPEAEGSRIGASTGQRRGGDWQRRSGAAARSTVESDEERAILQMLRSIPSLRSVANGGLACRIADHVAGGPHTGKLPLEDAMLAVQRAGEREADEAAGRGIGREQGQLSGFVMSFVKSQQIGEARAVAAREAALDPGLVTRFREYFDKEWSKAKRGRTRAHAAGDADHAERLALLAQDGATRAGGGISAEAVLAHWTHEHLRCMEKFIADADHPLRLMASRVDSYGLPRPKAARAVEQTTSARPPASSPEDAAAALHRMKAGAAAARAALTQQVGSVDAYAPRRAMGAQ